MTPLLLSCSLFCLDAQSAPGDDAAAPASAAATAVKAQFELQPDLIERHLGKGVTITGFTPQGFYDVNEAALNQRRLKVKGRPMEIGRSEDNNWIHGLMLVFVKRSGEGYSWIENLPAGFNLRTAITDVAAREIFERTYEVPADLTDQALAYQRHIDFAYWLQMRAASQEDADARGGKAEEAVEDFKTRATATYKSIMKSRGLPTSTAAKEYLRVLYQAILLPRNTYTDKKLLEDYWAAQAK